MILMIFASLVATISTSLFLIIYQTNGLNRSITCLPLAILENCVPSSSYKNPYFDKNKTIELLTYYYNSELNKYVKDYDVNFYFYNTNDESYCINDKCTALKVEVNATLMFNKPFSRAMYYEISGD